MSLPLIFEGVGIDLEELNGLSCRIRTRFIDGGGRSIYIELIGQIKHRHHPKSMKDLPYDNVGCVTHSRHLNDKKSYSEQQLSDVENSYFEYTAVEIVKFVNDKFGTAFEGLVIDHTLRVHDTDYAFC